MNTRTSREPRHVFRVLRFFLFYRFQPRGLGWKWTLDFLFQQGHWLKRNLLYKFPARYGVGHFHMGLNLHNACDKIKI